MAEKKPKYCVIARNRLTKEREVVTGPISREDAERIRFEYTNIRGTRKPYTHPKVELYPPQQLTLKFKD